ncbi:membrane protein UL56 [Bovine alphaherpesvirus 2]|uniref:Membrane protein UL56 n=1 Tax=Bovine alphaherpesvirus 2 TaxID=10295 RepID=A0ABX6WLZ8_9ALPH|nr:membrane protein UL56 [Bovine alphaherpesvirus 2]QPO25190.1 membrane protein UL56 [Bovine alphaherpesvirus 2]
MRTIVDRTLSVATTEFPPPCYESTGASAAFDMEAHGCEAESPPPYIIAPLSNESQFSTVNLDSPCEPSDAPGTLNASARRARRAARRARRRSERRARRRSEAQHAAGQWALGTAPVDYRLPVYGQPEAEPECRLPTYSQSEEDATYYYPPTYSESETRHPRYSRLTSEEMNSPPPYDSASLSREDSVFIDMPEAEGERIARPIAQRISSRRLYRRRHQSERSCARCSSLSTHGCIVIMVIIFVVAVYFILTVLGRHK